jgi:hypothetical protein
VAVDAQTFAFCFNKRQRLRASCSSANNTGERLCPMINITLNLLKLDFRRRISDNDMAYATRVRLVEKANSV